MNTLFKQTLPKLALLISSVSLVACGGGGGAVASSAALASSDTSTESTLLAATLTAVAAGTVTKVPVKNGTGTSPTTAVLITDATLESTATTAQTQVPITFGQVFAKGDVQPNVELTGVLADGTVVPLQVDAKANHADGSLRHAIITGVVTKLAAGQSLVLSMKKTTAIRPVQSTAPTSLLASGFTAGVTLKVAGQTYSVSANDLLKSGKYTTWLAGSSVNEWQVSAPLKTAGGVEHPHLSARFAIRSYTGLSRARVDVTIENDWAYEPNPSNFTYDVAIVVGGKTTYQKLGLNHLHHARWRKLAWWGTAPEVHIKHNQAYMIASRAIPNYDQTLVFSDLTLSSLQSKFAAAGGEPMGLGLSMAYMPTTGARPDIGLLPGWATTYLLSMDKRAKDVTLATADLAGSFSTHYRDKNTDRPISLFDYPYMTIIDPNIGDTKNPVTGKFEAFPACTNCASPYTSDVAHQPGYAYLPYLVTGDYYYLEELQFWAMANVFNGNPEYRQGIKGLVYPEQVRGQAWALRTLAEAAYITPDSDVSKKQFETLLGNNLDWYNQTYTNNPAANLLGVTLEGVTYLDWTALAPWQDDFFTSAIGHIAELGYDKANALLVWKSKFPISRMTGSGACWIDAAMYTMVVRPSASAALFTDIGTAYRANHSAEFNALPCGSQQMAAALTLKLGEMSGTSGSNTGQPSDMQPALAYSADAVPKAGMAAWNLFMSRSVKPNYSEGPQFAIIPR